MPSRTAKPGKIQASAEVHCPVPGCAYNAIENPAQPGDKDRGFFLNVIHLDAHCACAHKGFSWAKAHSRKAGNAGNKYDQTLIDWVDNATLNKGTNESYCVTHKWKSELGPEVDDEVKESAICCGACAARGTLRVLCNDLHWELHKTNCTLREPGKKDKSQLTVRQAREKYPAHKYPGPQWGDDKLQIASIRPSKKRPAGCSTLMTTGEGADETETVVQGPVPVGNVGAGSRINADCGNDGDAMGDAESQPGSDVKTYRCRPRVEFQLYKV